MGCLIEVTQLDVTGQVACWATSGYAPSCTLLGRGGIELVDPITAALAAGGAAGLSGVAAQAVKDAYAGLKSALSARFPQLGVHVQVCRYMRCVTSTGPPAIAACRGLMPPASRGPYTAWSVSRTPGPARRGGINPSVARW